MTDPKVTTLIIKVKLSMMDRGFVIMEPYDRVSYERLQRVLDVPKRTPVWFFNGSVYRTPGTTDELIGMWFICGGEEHRQRPGSLNGPDFRQAVHVLFDLDTVTDAEARTNLWLFGMYADVAVRLTPETTAQRLVLAPGQRCRRCYGQLTGSLALQWRFCDDCAADCDHSYVKYLELADGYLGYMPVCELCHRRDPAWRPSEDPLKELAKVIGAGLLDRQLLRQGVLPPLV